DVVARVDEARRRDGGIDSPAHRHDDAPRIHEPSAFSSLSLSGSSLTLDSTWRPLPAHECRRRAVGGRSVSDLALRVRAPALHGAAGDLATAVTTPEDERARADEPEDRGRD